MPLTASVAATGVATPASFGGCRDQKSSKPTPDNPRHIRVSGNAGTAHPTDQKYTRTSELRANADSRLSRSRCSLGIAVLLQINVRKRVRSPVR